MKRIIALTLALFTAATAFCGCGNATSGIKMKEVKATDASAIVINEVVTSNKYSYVLSDGSTPDWIELYNPTDSDINIKGCGLSKKTSVPFQYKFGDCTVPAGGYLVVLCAGEPTTPSESAIYTGFKLGKSGETLSMSLPSGTAISLVSVPELKTDVSYGRGTDGKYVYYAKPTPGAANSGETSTDGKFAEDDTGKGLLLNEYMVNNDYSIKDSDGERSPWVEIKNTTKADINIKGYSLTDDPDDVQKWLFPDVTVKAGAIKLIFLSGKDKITDKGEIHAGFKLKAGENMLLSNASGTLLDGVEVKEAKDGKSVGRGSASAGTWSYLFVPTPGAENTDKVAENADDESYVPDIRINEVKSSSTTSDDGTKTYDWIELYNAGSADADLSGWGLSDKKDDQYRYKFDGVTLGAGKYLVVECKNTKAEYSASFGLSASSDDVYLSDTTGAITDHLNTGVESGDMSVGRADGQGSEKVFFEKATKGEANGGTFYKGYAAEPVFSTAGGYATSGTKITMTNSDGSDIYYTTDGSLPTQNSKKYSGAVTISATMTLRARSFTQSKLPSTTTTENYIVTDKKHSIPVVCISMNPDDLMGETNGIYANGPGYDKDDGIDYTHTGANYWQDWERAMNFEFFEADGTKGVGFDAGIKIHGQFSREQGQKSFSVHLRGKYGQSSVTYPFFRDYDVTTFTTLVLRSSGQDWNRTKILDAFVAQIEKGQADIDYMEYRPVALYINGSYWGLYNMREKQNEDYVVSHHASEGAVKGKVDIVKADFRVRAGSSDEWKDFVTNYVHAKDLSTEEARKYVEERVDMKELMEWVIIEAYCDNTDTGNKRKFRWEGGKWRWMLFDTDWAFQTNGYAEKNFLGALLTNEMHGAGNAFRAWMFNAIMKNNTWRKEFVELCAKRINTTFADDRIDAIIDKMAAEIDSEIDRNNTERDKNTYTKWKSLSHDEWLQNIAALKDTCHKRRELLKKELQQTFGLSDARMKELFG